MALLLLLIFFYFFYSENDDVIFKNAKVMVWRQQDKERYGGRTVRGNGRNTWCEETLFLLLMTVIFFVVDDNVYLKKSRSWYGSNKTRSDVRSNGRKTWCEEIASAGIDLPSTNHLSCKTFNIC